jgi:hypothetical protein
MTLIIGFGHTSRCGKDTIANELVSELNSLGVRAKKLSFAWKMKQIAYELYGWAGVQPPEYYETKEGEQDREIKLTKLASSLFPTGPTVVDVWVAIGTPAFRQAVYPRTWIDYITQVDHQVDVLVIPDCRFLNEVDAVRESGGKVFRCVRQGFAGRDTVADRELRGKEVWDGTIGGHDVLGLRRQATKFAVAIRLGLKVEGACIDPDYWTAIYYKNLEDVGYAKKL